MINSEDKKDKGLKYIIIVTDRGVHTYIYNKFSFLGYNFKRDKNIKILKFTYRLDCLTGSRVRYLIYRFRISLQTGTTERPSAL